MTYLHLDSGRGARMIFANQTPTRGVSTCLTSNFQDVETLLVGAWLANKGNAPMGKSLGSEINRNDCLIPSNFL